MISEVVMPQMGADMKEGTILRWLKSEGDQVNRGEVIAEIETDKANVEIEAFEGGVFRKVIAPEGETIPVGTVIAVIGGADDDISAYEGGERRSASDGSAATTAPAPTEAPPAPEQPAQTDAPPASPSAAPAEPPPARVEAPAVAQAPAQAEARLRVSPVARRLAEELGVDLAMVRGTGPDGRIVRRDVEEAQRRPAAAAPAAPAPPPPFPAAPPAARPALAAAPAMALPEPGRVIDIPLSRMRQTIARRMTQSKQEAPHYYLSVEVDMTEAVAMRAQINQALGDSGRVSINDLLILASTRTVQRHPRFNSWWVEDHVQVHGRINIGIAIALDDGLVAPAILDCQSKPLTQISQEARDLAERARAGTALTPEEYSAGTFTITNLGAFGVDGLVGIINPPQTSILGVGRVEERPVVRDGQIVIRWMMTVILSADHRATDGAEGARFLQTLKEYLEKPALMFV
jgi:pyruvate dehydrogenase E2 component (dihydrolipoamide acetyltransferase)